MSYDPTPTKIKGGQEEAWVADQELRNKIEEVLIQLKIMNEHLSIVSGEDLNETDINLEKR